MTSLESHVLQHKSLARLAQIKQMGLAFLDFPGLTHSRLEHSIGVMHVADKMFQTLCNSDRFPRQRRKRLLGSGDGSQVRQAVRLAALCHDLGHPPFSHAVEATFKRYPSLLERAISGAVDLDDARLFKAYSHEEFTRWSIRAMMSRRGSIANRIRKKLGKELSSEIADLAIGKASGVLEPFNPIISGEFDADRIDYLIRDNRRSGFVLGLSLDEIHNAIHLNQDERDQFRLFIDASALPFVNSVLLARQRLIRRVHLAPSGRVATQMMINCLFCILDRYQEPAELAKTIKWLHVDCTDFTFFRRLLKESESVGSLDPLNEYYVRRFERVARRPHATNLWPERVNIDFMQMHPCLRLLAHIVASSNWKSPRHLTFQDRGRCYFIEPNTRPSQASDLQVDYGRNPHDGTTPGESPGSNRQRQRSEPSLDFVGASENRLGRGILAQAMSNLDVFAYELNASPDRKVELPVPVSGLDQLGSGAKTSGHSDYCANLRGLGKRVGRSIVTVAQQIREEWPFQELGMIATDFVLALLYALDNEVRSHWPSARGIYVYRSEFFVNQFVPSFLNEGESWTHEEVDLFPQIFRDPENAGKRIFSQIQRLAAFGLILTRSNSSINRRPRGGESGATRFGVHSTREEIRINTWGRCYVENEVAAEHIEGIRRIVACRQKEMRTAQHRLSTLYMQFDAPPSPMTLSDLGRIERQRLKLAQAIHDGRGCALTFSHAEGSGAMRRRAT